MTAQMTSCSQPIPFMTEKLNLSTTVFESLKIRIIKWEYPPGYRLTEEELCQEFGVSRVPVREALSMLEKNNLLDKIPHRGCTVKQPNTQEIHELYDVRLALELFVAGHLATHGMDGDEWQRLFDTWTPARRAELVNAEKTDEVDGLRLAQEDEDFHESLAAATGNGTLLELLRTFNERLRFIRVIDITTVARLRETCAQHQQILQCIRAGDAEAAQAAIRRNIDGGRRSAEAALKEALARAYMNIP